MPSTERFGSADDTPAPARFGDAGDTVAPKATGPSIMERIGTGIADPLLGIGQLTRHMGFVAPEEYEVMAKEGRGPATAAEVDATMRKREEGYQAERKAGGQSGIDWWRGAGNIFSPANLPLMAIPGGAVLRAGTALGRMGAGAASGAAAGAAGGLIQPVTGDNYGAEKAKQVGIGAAVGTPIGAAGGLLVKAITKQTPAEAEKFIRDAYKVAIKPSVAGKGTVSQLDQYNQKVASAISTIVENKPNLRFADEFGETAAGQLPKSIDQFAEAVNQTKRGIFQKYDALAQQAGQQGVKVELSPIVGELSKIAEDGVVKDLHPELSAYAERLAKTLGERGVYSATDAQRAIENLNVSLKAFYKSPSYETASRASVDALIANNLRKGLDSVIEGTVAPGYQALKNQYGALRTIETDVVHRSIVEGRKNLGGGIMGNIGDVFSAEQVLHGVLTLNPQSIATGGALKAATTFMRYLRNPNRAVEKLFEAAERNGPKTESASPFPMTGGMQPARPVGPGQKIYAGSEAPEGALAERGGSARQAAPVSPTPQTGGVQPSRSAGPETDLYGGPIGPEDILRQLGGRAVPQKSAPRPPPPFRDDFVTIPSGGRNE